MHVNKRAAWLALALALVMGGLACQTTDRIMTIAQANAPTPTRTRTPRPTFTTQPPATDTPAPTDTATATTVPPTRTATRRPTARPTLPPTPKPVAVQPTTPRYQYTAAGVTCEHSGSSWIKGRVYEYKSDPNSAVPGLKVVFGGGGGDAYTPPVSTDGEGIFSFTLTTDEQHSAKIGTYYVWIVDNSGNRISDMAGPIKIDGGPPDNGCWAGNAYFYKNP